MHPDAQGVEPGRDVVVPFLKQRGIHCLDLVVLSHAHPDHLEGLFAVFAELPVQKLWTPGSGVGNPRFQTLVDLAVGKGTRVDIPEPLNWGRSTIVPVHPVFGAQIRVPPGMGANDASLVVLVSVPGGRLLFAGDVEAQGEAEMAALGGVEADVLKVPHHGSRKSSTSRFLDAVAPRVAVASLGAGNSFGFPGAEVLARYRKRQIPVFRTDIQGGTTVIVSALGGLSVFDASQTLVWQDGSGAADFSDAAERN